MKVLFHSMYYAPEVGGLESHVRGLAEGLVRRGHDVRLVTSRSRPGLARTETMAGVALRRARLPGRSPIGWALFAAGSISPMRAWASWADVIHAESFASVLPAGVAASAAGRPLVASFHTSHFLELARKPGWRPVLRRLVRRPDRSLAASVEIARVAEGLAPGIRVEALTNGVDTERFAPPPSASTSAPQPTGTAGRATILVPRRLVPKNGVEHFVRALPEILRRIPGASAVVVGDGPERGRLEALANEVGVTRSIVFRGARPHDAMPEVYGSADVAVFPSLLEATSVAALEAMSCGVPVVATRVGGLPEIVDDEVGALVPPGDPAALAAAVVALLTGPDRAEKGRRARERVVARWSNDRLVERHLEIYRELLAARGVSSAFAGGRS